MKKIILFSLISLLVPGLAGADTSRVRTDISVDANGGRAEVRSKTIINGVEVENFNQSLQATGTAPLRIDHEFRYATGTAATTSRGGTTGSETEKTLIAKLIALIYELLKQTR